jgi:formate hydrogenlyase transcriptional activator
VRVRLEFVEVVPPLNYELRPLGGGAADGADDGQPLKGEPDRSRLLLEINNAVVSLLDLESLLKVIFDRVRQVFRQTTAATLSIYDPESNQLRVHLLHSPQPETFREGMPIELEGTPSGLAFSSRQTVLIHRLVPEDFPTPLVERAYADGVRSGCSVPLISHNRVVGTLTVGAFGEAAYSEADAELLAQVARQIAMPVENALNYERATKEGARVRTLLEVNNAIATNLNIRDLLRATSGCLRAYFKHDFAALALYDEKTDSLHVHAFDRARPDTDIYEGEPVPVEGTLTGLAFTTRRAVYRSPINDLRADGAQVLRAAGPSVLLLRAAHLARPHRRRPHLGEPAGGRHDGRGR